VSFMTSVLSSPAAALLASEITHCPPTFRVTQPTPGRDVHGHHCLYPAADFEGRRVAAAGGR